MRFLSLFSGIGGMDYGLMQAGHECVGFVEMDKFAHEAFEILHDPKGELWSAYDIRDVTDDDIRQFRRERGPIQLIAGGFPCQAFSIAGKREGFRDATRGTLFFEILRFASILKPNHLLLENVTGLLNHDGGRTFGIILNALAELGYDAEWQVHNSSAYVPQNRERVFIVGHLRGRGRRKIFPFGGENKNTIEVIGRLKGSHDQNSRVYGTWGLAPTLSTMQGGGQEPKIAVSEPSNYYSEIKCINPRKKDGTQTYQHDRVFDARGIITALDTDSLGRKNIYHNHRIRKLTPLECFRLQSYPDEWYYKLKEAGISDTQLYKMAGNGVTSIVAYEIGKRLGEAYVI